MAQHRPMSMLFRHALLVLLDVAVLLANYLAVAWVLSIFTHARPDLDEAGDPWGGWFGTWDNPPQGDSKWQRECWFPHITTGFRGSDFLQKTGSPGVALPQPWVRVPALGGGRIFYKKQGHRGGGGWKIMTDKFERYGFATMVDSVNPIKTYGK